MVVLVVYVWDQVQFIINGLMSVVDILNYYKNQVGSIDVYLGKFKDVFYYKGLLCFFLLGCLESECKVMEENCCLVFELQKKVNDVLFCGFDQQQSNFKFDVVMLE